MPKAGKNRIHLEGATGTAELCKKIDILGVGVHPVTLEEATATIAGWIRQARSRAGFVGGEASRLHQVITMNPEMLYVAWHDPALRELLNRGDLVVADGYGIVWAGKLLDCPFPERVAGIDLIESLAVQAVEAGWRLYLLGGAPGVAEAAAVNLKQRRPGLQVAGTGDGYFTEAALPGVLGRIRDSAPDLLLVGMGFPRQEYFIRNHRQRLGPLVAIGVGGSFDVISGRLRRSPAWVRRLRLEWLFRVFQEPARWRRLFALPLFAGLVLSARRRRV